jgi:hypothetical protein
MQQRRKMRRPENTRDIRYTNFPCFNRLPLELRRLVWKHACFHQRNVDITASYTPNELYDHWDESYYDDVFYYLSICPPPAVLRVNKESRTEALKWYSLDFGTQPTLNPIYATPPHIYINWHVDRICFLNWGLLSRAYDYAAKDFQERCSRNKLRYLACNLSGGISNWSIQNVLPPQGLDLVELDLFSSKAMFYQSLHPARFRLEDRKMNQIGAFKDVIDAVVEDRKRRELEMVSTLDNASRGGEQASSTVVEPLVVKLVRVLR